MKILITGANGFLGQHLCAYFTLKNFTVLATGRNTCIIPQKYYTTYIDLELTNQLVVIHLIKQLQPDVIVHTAAMSKPDICEVNKEACLLNNVSATSYLVEAANLINAHLLFASTDFIFGENGPHKEEDVPNPLNFYGHSKLLAEEIIKTKANTYTIFRPVFMYGRIWGGLRPTFLHWVKNQLGKNEMIQAVSDQLRTPTYIEDICKGIDAIIHQKATGIYHLGGIDIISPYDMAMITAEKLGLNTSYIQQVTAANFPEPVQRAKQSGVLIQKAMNELQYYPISFEEGVKKTFNL